MGDREPWGTIFKTDTDGNSRDASRNGMGLPILGKSLRIGEVFFPIIKVQPQGNRFDDSRRCMLIVAPLTLERFREVLQVCRDRRLLALADQYRGWAFAWSTESTG